jgi:hypothetical protein
VKSISLKPNRKKMENSNKKIKIKNKECETEIDSTGS